MKVTTQTERSIRLVVWAPIVTGILAVSVWACLTVLGEVETWRLPDPLTTLMRGIEMLSQPLFWFRIGVTLAEAILGSLLGALVAIPLSIALHSSRTVSAALEPFIGASQALPAIAIAPLLVLWLGYGIVPIAVLCALMVFFPIMVATTVGLDTIDQELIEAALLDGAGFWTLLRRIKLPLAAPNIVAGIRNGFTLSFTGAIVGEMVMGGQGLGQTLTQSRQALDTSGMFVVIFVLCALSASVYFSLRSVEYRLYTQRFGS